MHLVFVILIFALIYVLQKRLYFRFWRKGLSTSVRFSREYMDCGEEAELSLEIVNDKLLPLPVFHLKFSVDRALRFHDMENSVVTDLYHRNDAFSLLGYQKVRRKIAFTSEERGFFRVESVNMMVRDFFLTATFAETKKEDTGIYVFPRKLDRMKIAEIMRGQLGERAVRHSILEDPLSFRGLREYQPQDPFRSINMKQSARTGEWKVNLREATEDAELRILLNLDTEHMIRRDRMLEESISLCSTLAEYFLSKKERVSVWSNGRGADEKQLSVPGVGAELSHGITIDKYLAEIRTSAGKDVFLDRLEREISGVNKSVLYLIISPYFKEDLLEHIDLLRRDAEVQMIVPYYRKMGLPICRPYLTGWEVDEYAE